MTTYENITKTRAKKLKKHGFIETEPKTKYEVLRLTGPASIVLYSTGKLVVQGSKQAVAKTSKLIEFLGIAAKKKGLSGEAIGSDESLKGDTFGGIVVAAFKADDKTRQKIVEMGVKDSKQMLKPDIVRLAKELIEEFPKDYHVENIYPKEYNKLNTKYNVTQIMDMLHKKCYKKLAGRKKIIHVVDLYPGCSVGTIMEKKAESKYPEVAAASIIARYHALTQIRELEQRGGFFIPLGSTHVESALIEIKKKSLNPKDFVKLKFRNVRKLFG